MTTATWKVVVKGSFRPCTEGFTPKELEEICINDLCEFEVCVSHKDHTPQDSFGWNNLQNIILFDSDMFENPPDQTKINWMMYAANSLCEALNNSWKR